MESDLVTRVYWTHSDLPSEALVERFPVDQFRLGHHGLSKLSDEVSREIAGRADYFCDATLNPDSNIKAWDKWVVRHQHAVESKPNGTFADVTEREPVFMIKRPTGIVLPYDECRFLAETIEKRAGWLGVTIIFSFSLERRTPEFEQTTEEIGIQ